MDILEKALLEWSLRTDKGYPDISNEEDLHIFESTFGFKLNEQDFALDPDSTSDKVDHYEEILRLLDVNKDNKKVLNRVYRTLSSTSYIDKIKEYLNESGITKDTFDSRNLPNEIITILLKGSKPSVEQFYNEIIKKEVKLPKSENVKTLIKDEVLREKVLRIGNIKGRKGSSGIGAGEILFPLIFSDIRLPDKSSKEKGDLYYNGKKVEVKSINGRLGKTRDVKGYKPFFKTTEMYSGSRYLEDIIFDDYNEALNTLEEDSIIKFRKRLSEFLKDTYKYSTESITDFESKNDVYKLLIKACIEGYSQSTNIDYFIFYKNDTGYYQLLSPDSTVAMIIGKKIKITNFSKSTTIPQFKDIS